MSRALIGRHTEPIPVAKIRIVACRAIDYVLGLISELSTLHYCTIDQSARVTCRVPSELVTDRAVSRVLQRSTICCFQRSFYSRTPATELPVEPTNLGWVARALLSEGSRTAEGLRCHGLDWSVQHESAFRGARGWNVQYRLAYQAKQFKVCKYIDASLSRGRHVASCCIL